MNFSNETETMVSGGYGGGYGRGLGGFGGCGGGGIWDLIALGMVTNGGFFGNNRRDHDDCCCAPATAASVCEVDKDVLSTANQTQHEICEATHDIETAIAATNTNLGDKITSGFYNLNDKLTALAYAQQNTAKDTQTLIVQKFADLETKSLAAANNALEQEVNRFKTIEAICACSHGGKS